MTSILPESVPIISVVMPVYNSERYLQDSIESILRQTYTDLELICVDDGSRDSSLEILQRYESRDPRVRVIAGPNTGGPGARNSGMSVARGKYIAAMDSDDVALPERLHRQLVYMESHPGCVCSGAAVRIVGPDLMPIRDEPKALDHETIDCETLAGDGAAIRHPVAIFRADAVREVGGYQEQYREEQDIYLRLAEIGRLANLPDILLLYRLRLGSVNRTRYELQEQRRPVIVRNARLRRGLPIDSDTKGLKQASIQPDDGQESWAIWSHDAFNGGYLDTARRYAWRAIRYDPLAVPSWKAILRAYLPSVARISKVTSARPSEAKLGVNRPRRA
jgi:glycosyltransferase involved in cell wall biosynthesis